MNKEQERSLKFVDGELKLDVVDRVVTQNTKHRYKKCNILKDCDTDANKERNNHCSYCEWLNEKKSMVGQRGLCLKHELKSKRRRNK
ncbi:hypothetical protein YC2023_070733 [Brassica napus]